MSRDWLQWHGYYDDPSSSLINRLSAVHEDLRSAMAAAPHRAHGVQRLISICAGEGRDVLPVLADQELRERVDAVLIELDPAMAERTLGNIEKLGLSRVEVLSADAGATDTYADLEPADILLASGVFGNVSMEDAKRTVALLPALVVPDGIVVWTRSGALDAGRDDPSQELREWFLGNGFEELSYRSTEDGGFRVGVHRRQAGPGEVSPLEPGVRMFSFT